jgi:hypothetical protein
MSLSDIDAVRQQIAQCWSLPAGAKDAQDLIIEVRAVVGADRIVSSASIVNSGRAASDPFFRAAAESALRAVLNPRCQPLRLPPDRYEQWKVITFEFNPKEALQ